MDFTKKLKSFVARQEQKSPEPQPPETAAYLREQVVPVRESEQLESNPELEQQVLQSIEPIYYSDESFDAAEYELKKLPEVPDLKDIGADRSRLKKQLHVVSKKVSELILQHQGGYLRELDRVADLHSALEDAICICQEGRKCLGGIQSDFTSASLGILSSYRKREKLKSLLRALHSIKTLQETDVRLRELLEEEDYFGAIQLCLECRKAASTFQHYTCISELHSKLQDTLEMTEEQLDVALSKVCINFDQGHYRKLQAAYSLLGKTQTATDQLVMHFSGAIHNRAFTIVLGYVELYAPTTGHLPSHKRLYSDLCKQMSPEGFLPCLRDLCKALWMVVQNYWQVLEWHHSATEENGDQQSYVLHKLTAGKARVWQDIQQKIKVFLSGSDLASTFKFDQFIRILDIVSRLIEVGEEFCESQSEDLQETIRRQTVNYFKTYHRSCLDELRMFLENESWTLCPVRYSFSIFQLQEFAFLKQLQEDKPCRDNDLASQHKSSFFPNSNPFHLPLADEELEREESLFVEQQEEEEDEESEGSDIPEELTKEYCGTLGDSSGRRSKGSLAIKEDPTTMPMVTNTTLNILRLFGKYLRMMSVLKPIAFDVLICLCHLYDYYMYSVYLFFAGEMENLNENILSNKLRTVIKRAEETLILLNGDLEDSRHKDKVPAPQLSPVVGLHNEENLFGLNARIAATESLVFLAQQLSVLQSYLESHIPPSKRTFLQQFLSQTSNTCIELRRPVYLAVALQAVNYDNIVALMSTVRFDIHEILSQHSHYVDILLRELQVLSMRLEAVSPLPPVVSGLVWEHTQRLVSRTLVEGFSSARRCTPEGRALMQLDFQQLLTKLEPLAGGMSAQDRDLVEAYIKAFYLLEPGLEDFIQNRKEYSSKQLTSLVLSVSQLNKKGRQRLLSLIEDRSR